MKRKDWMWVLLPLIATWALDRVTKQMALGIDGFTFYGPLGLVLHKNPGAILGLFGDLPKVLRIVSLSTGGAFLLFLFGIIQFILPSKSMKLRIGLSFLIGGIVGNVTDRIMWGSVVDFIIIGTPKLYSPAFNLADALQWVGYFLILITVIKEGKDLWPVENARKSYWINSKFQLRYCFMMVLCGLGLTLVLGTYSYTYLEVIIHELRAPNPVQPGHFLMPFVATFAMVSLMFCGVLFIIGMILSHRVAGPLHAFERFLNDLVDGKDPKLKLRTGDDFKHLEKLANKLSQDLNPKSWRSKSG
jgi:signal peptidase II